MRVAEFSCLRYNKHMSFIKKPIVLIAVGALLIIFAAFFLFDLKPNSQDVTPQQITPHSTAVIPLPNGQVADTDENTLSLLEPKLPEGTKIIKIEKGNFGGRPNDGVAVVYRLGSSTFQPRILTAVYVENAEGKNYVRKETFSYFGTEEETKECDRTGCSTQFLTDAVVTDFDKDGTSEITLVYDLGAGDRSATFFSIYKYKEGKLDKFDIPFEVSKKLATEEVIKIFKDAGMYITVNEAKKSTKNNSEQSMISDQEMADAINKHLDDHNALKISKDSITTTGFASLQNDQTGYCSACGAALAEIHTIWAYSSGKFVVKERTIVPTHNSS